MTPKTEKLVCYPDWNAGNGDTQHSSIVKVCIDITFIPLLEFCEDVEAVVAVSAFSFS